MGGWDAVVDVSNVCWDEQLPPRGWRAPVWGRLGLVMAAWRRQHGNAARLDLVADQALIHGLDDARGYGRLLAAGELVAVPHADVEMLALAREHELHVITRDRFLQHRGEHAWIAHSPERFHRWQYSGGKVSIVPLGIEWAGLSSASPPAHPSSEHLRLVPRHPRFQAFLQTRWQCGSARCPEGGQRHLLVLPLVSVQGEPRCPVCGGPLKDRGQRRREFHEIVVADLATEAELLRFALEADETVTIGSSGTRGGLSLSTYADSQFSAGVAKVSRRHVTFGIEMPQPGLRRMVVTDLWSSSGTTVQHPSGTGLGKPKPVEPGRETPVMEGGRVILADAVTLRLSARL